ncbi:hypothetical protein AAE478_001659 [Parahypoxylon ruwenzoriense]
MATSNLTHPTAARRSTKEPFSSAPVTPNTYLDPPRPAKEGHEWVWFPAGYWAEREIIENPGKVMKHFKWRKRSGKSSSGRDTQDDTEHSPQPLTTPFLTEEAHVQSLQRPPHNYHGASGESGGSSFPLHRTQQTQPLPSPYLTEEAHVQSLQRPPLGYHTSGSESGTSLSELTSRPLQSSPLGPVKGEADLAALATPTDLPAGPPGSSLSSRLHLSPPATKEAKPKRSLMSRLFPDHKLKVKKTHSDGDDDAAAYAYACAHTYDYTASTIAGARAQLLNHSQTQLRAPARTPTPTPPLMSRVVTLLREETWRPRSRKLFGRSPWHRKASAGSEASASSSLRNVLRGRTPVSSPASDLGAYYGDPSNSVCPQFPGGEAMRVKTPPLHEGGNRAGRPRSFFFDISTPPRDDCSSGGDSDDDDTKVSESHRYRYHHRPASEQEEDGSRDQRSPKEKTGEEKRKGCGPGKEWWEVPVAVPRYETLTPSTFEFDMPEHLPNSPMCPTNKRHQSGGTGVCVYHGRRKRSVSSAADGEGDKGGEDDEDDDGGDEDDDGDVWT